MRSLIHRLCSCSSISGDEAKISKIIFEKLKSFDGVQAFVDESFNNVVASIGRKDSKRKILLDAHIDQVGMMVTHVEKGFLKVDSCGSLDPRILPGSKVKIFAKETIDAVVCSLPPHLANSRKQSTPVKDLIIDTLLDDAQKFVEPGTYVAFYPEVLDLLGNKILAPALDNRASVASLIRCLEILSGQIETLEKLECNVVLLFSSREEMASHAGAVVGTYILNPDEALVVDVSFGSHPFVSNIETKELGKGPLIGISPTLSKSIYKKLQNVAKKENIPYQLEIMSGRTSTNADVICVSRYGVKSGLLSIPLRYMHNPSEVIDIEDIENTAKLLACYILN